MGNVADATNFFIESPTLPLLVETGFDNPADFLCDISSNLVCDTKVMSIAFVIVNTFNLPYFNLPYFNLPYFVCHVVASPLQFKFVLFQQQKYTNTNVFLRNFL